MNDKYVRFFQRNNFIYILVTLALATIMSFSSITAFATPSSDTDQHLIKYKEVLILSSQNENGLWESSLLDNLNTSLTSSDLNIHTRIESLSMTNNDNSYLDKQADLWSLKYKNTKFDLIIPLDDESLNFIGNYYTTPMFKDVPVVYGGINDVTKLSSYPFNNFTGVMEPINVRTLVDLILHTNPNTSEMNILLDNTIASKYIENQVRDTIPYYNNVLKFNFIRSDYIDDLCYKLSQYPSNTPSIIVGNFKDTSNIIISPKNATHIINNYSHGQLYTFNETYVGNGAIGGHILYAKNHSKIIYETAIRVLNGAKPKEIPSVYDPGSTLLFDASEMTANNISRSSLPENVVFINDSWINKGVSIGIVFLLLLILLICMIMLAIQTIQKTNNAKSMIAAKKRYDELLISDKIKTEFLANFSHEIRTLLNVILSGLQLLDIYKDNGKLTFANKEDEIKLVYIRQNGFRLLKLINNLIDMTKIDSGFYHVEFEVKNIVEVVEDITMSVIEYASARGISIVFDTNEEEIYMPLDSEKLDRIILNLLSNAIKFTPKGGCIYVTLKCSEHSISVSVKDTGIGIPKDKQRSIFERFTQVKNEKAKSKEGSGIGLSLVKSLVELLDGSIILKSEPSKGCEFIFTLPIKEFDKATEDVENHISQNISDNSEKLMVEFSDIDSNLNI
ncbi:sensor histidine kinase [Clostridium sp.]|uniref:sensor histidine kinase n=1 Tax=Clostridium sp. TaxID=1506 RepID=UPI0032176DDA